VRSQEKGDYLADLFKGSSVPFECAIVEDIEQVGGEMSYTRSRSSPMLLTRQ
jgi:hypothetical protein